MTAMESDRAREAWDGIAPGFDELVTPFTTLLAEEALRRADLRPGERFLDVAAGSGALSIPAARLGAEVLATDISPALIERLDARAREEALPNLEARVMDGQALDLEDGTFDVSASQNGVTLFPDLQGGLRELVRVTKPGGRALIVAFGPLRKAEFLTVFVGAMRAAVPGFTGLPTEPPPLPFQVADPETLRRELAEAGLRDVRIEAVTWSMEFQSATHMWGVVTSSNPIATGLVSRLTEDQKAEVRAVLDRMLHERAGGGPTVLNTEVNVAIGRK